MVPTLPRYLLGLALLCGAAVACAADAPPDIDPELRAALKQAVEDTTSFDDRYDAEVWMHDMSNRMARFIPDPNYRVQLLRDVHYEATRAKLEPELVLAVIHVESAFNPFAISVVGARGLMQVMPFWVKEIGKPNDNLFNARTNLRYGCTILRHYLDKEKGNRVQALARYNGSRGWKYPSKVYQKLSTVWFRQ